MVALRLGAARDVTEPNMGRPAHLRGRTRGPPGAPAAAAAHTFPAPSRGWGGGRPRSQRPKWWEEWGGEPRLPGTLKLPKGNRLPHPREDGVGVWVGAMQVTLPAASQGQRPLARAWRPCDRQWRLVAGAGKKEKRRRSPPAAAQCSRVARRGAAAAGKVVWRFPCLSPTNRSALPPFKFALSERRVSELTWSHHLFKFHPASAAGARSPGAYTELRVIPGRSGNRASHGPLSDAPRTSSYPQGLVVTMFYCCSRPLF
jgi:hypothetical protein